MLLFCVKMDIGNGLDDGFKPFKKSRLIHLLENLNGHGWGPLVVTEEKTY